ncbi:MAG: hypothetical protein AAFS12_05630 [Cyanobacteria bacterium J06632_19]
MNKEQIEKLIAGLNKFHWHNDYQAFCNTLDFNRNRSGVGDELKCDAFQQQNKF